MEKRVLLGQFSDQAQAQATLSALTDLGRAMRRPVRAEIVTAYQVIAKVNSPLRAQKDLKLTDKSAVRSLRPHLRHDPGAYDAQRPHAQQDLGQGQQEEVRRLSFGPWRWMEIIVIGLSLGLNVGDVFYVGTPAYEYVSRPGDVALAVLFGALLLGFYRNTREGRKIIYEIERYRTLSEMEAQRYNAHFQATMGPFLRKQMGRDYMVTDRADAIVCFYCGMVSHNPNDVRERYCGECHRFLGIMGTA